MDLSSHDRRFPRPPLSVTDRAGRQITVKSYDGGPEPLVEMYAAFDEPATRGLPPRTDAEIREWVSPHLEDGLNVVARHDWEVIGHAALVPHAETAELLVFVRPADQSLGVGTQLIRGLLGHGQEHGVENVWLSVTCDNLPLIRIATGIGFEPPTHSRVEFRLERGV